MEVGREKGCYIAPIFPRVVFFPNAQDLPFRLSCRSSFNRVFIPSWQIMMDCGRVLSALVETSHDTSSASGSGWKSRLAAKSLQPAAAILARKMGKKHKKKGKSEK